MASATFVLAFDPGTHTGWCRGEPGDKTPASGAVTLKKPHESLGMLSHNLRALFLDLIRDRKPDLVVWEAPWSVEAWFAHCKKKGQPQNGNSVLIQNHLAMCLMGLCDGRDIAWNEVVRVSVMKHFTGRGSWTSAKGAGDGRERGKQAVLARAKVLGMMPALSNDDDRGDAIANWHYATSLWGGRMDRELLLFDEGKLAHGSRD